MPTFDRSLPMMLHRTLDAVMPPFRDLFAHYDLTEQQWRILRVLWSSTKVTSVELSNRTLIAPSSLVGVVDRLERKELVTRVRSVDDRRIVYVIATQKGREIEKQVTVQVSDIHAKLRSAVTEEEWAQMEHVLEKIATASTKQNDRKTSATGR